MAGGGDVSDGSDPNEDEMFAWRLAVLREKVELRRRAAQELLENAERTLAEIRWIQVGYEVDKIKQIVEGSEPW
jgi:hypothetical protein